MARWLIFGLNSLFLIWPGSSWAAWSIAQRPLDSAPYSRAYPSAYKIGTKSLIHLEGQAVKLSKDKPKQITIDLSKVAAKRYLEYQLGYLSKKEKIAPSNQCQITLKYFSNRDKNGQTEKKLIPLRSVSPQAIKMEEILASYDYFMPMSKIDIPDSWKKMTLEISVEKECEHGDVVFYDPKVWHKKSEKKANRFILIITDSLADDWFKQKRRFMPALQDFFNTGQSKMVTNVVSPGTNTLDTSRVLISQKMVLRDGQTFIPPKENLYSGMVPTFLNAGYDAISFNSNYLLSTDYAKSGIRNFTNFNLNGSLVNERNPEILVNMTLDWLKRHPDHDVFIFLWFDSTHVGGVAKQVRPEFSLKKVPYHQKASKDTIELQAKSMSYEDIHFERLFESDLVKDSDIIFSTDHGINYNTLHKVRPAWGACKGFSIGANWHLAPVEVMIPVGIHLRNKKVPKNISYKTALSDWVITAVNEHNPAIDTSDWLGQNLNKNPAELPVLALSHGGRAGIFYRDKRILVSDEVCPPKTSIYFLNDREEPASVAETAMAMNVLLKHMESKLAKVKLDLLAGSKKCKIDISAPTAITSQGQPFKQRSINFNNSNWYKSVEFFFPKPLGRKINVAISTSPTECAQLRGGLIKRDIKKKIDLYETGFGQLLESAKQRLKPEAKTQIVATGVLKDYYLWNGKSAIRGDFADVKEGTKEKEFSAELKAAMKRWGYIQDDE